MIGRRVGRIVPVLAACLGFTLPLLGDSLKLPASAMTDDTFMIVSVDMAKVTPIAFEQAARAALGDRGGEMLRNHKVR